MAKKRKKKDHGNLSKQKVQKIVQNLVAKHSRNMTGAGAHTDKKGEKAPRVRQKREWKKELKMLETYDENSKAFQAATTIFDRYEDHWKTPEDFESVEHEASLVVNDLPEDATIEEIVQTVLKLNPELKPVAGASMARKLEGEETGFKMLESIQETLGDPFDQAIREVEKEFNINLAEGVCGGAEEEELDARGLSDNQMRGLVDYVHDELLNGASASPESVEDAIHTALDDVPGFETGDRDNVVGRMVSLYNQMYGRE
jgi:hypothetical protein